MYILLYFRGAQTSINRQKKRKGTKGRTKSGKGNHRECNGKSDREIERERERQRRQRNKKKRKRARKKERERRER